MSVNCNHNYQCGDCKQDKIKPISKCTCTPSGQCNCGQLIPPAIDWSKPVQTIDGRALEVLSTNGTQEWPVICKMAPWRDDPETIALYKMDGRASYANDVRRAVNRPVEVLQYLNVYCSSNSSSLSFGCLYGTLEMVKNNRKGGKDYLHTIVFTFDEAGNYLRSEKVDLRK